MPLPSGTHFGRYEIVAPIGAGGMGEVYKAHDTELRRDIAIKILQGTVADRNSWDRFRREARTASSLSHPNICAVYDVGESEGRPFLVMELLDGVTLSQYLADGPLEAAIAIALAVQIADALEAAHLKGIIHRDIKPGNVMITGRRQHVKVLDFGLAKQMIIDKAGDAITLESISAETIMGTPQYLAPEVLQG